jgi:hypothetical protein
MLLASCKQGTFYGALGDQIVTIALSIAPTAGTIADGSTMTFSATGGAPPYAYTVVSGPGSINSSTGVFTAAGGGTAVIRVTDKNKKTSDATLTVTPTGLLALNPSSATVNVNVLLQFVATGGIFPYHFSTSLGSGSPTIDPNLGLYRSGFTTGGSDTVTVTDSTPGTPQVATSIVNVSATATNVDYTFQSVSPPAAGTSGKATTGNFTIINNGSALGTQALSWWVYISDSCIFNTAGMQILCNNVAGGLGPSATTNITINTGTWPAVPVPGPVNKYLFFQIAAADDLNAANNFAGPYTVTISPPNVDYSATAPTHTGPLVAGGPINESFTLQNNGLDAGSQTVQWTAYVSSDSLTAISAGDTIVKAGTAGPLGASPASTSIGITGTWPSAHGAYFLKVKLSAPDDVNTANNIQVSTVYNTTYVDYTPPASQIQPTGGQVAGGLLNGEFKIQNLGTADGTQNISWTAYVAPTLTPTVVTQIDAGTAGPVTAGATSGFIPFSGTWPTSLAPNNNFVLVVSLSSPEDTVPANNVRTSVAGYGTTSPSVDYAVSLVTNTGAATAPVMGPMTGSFRLSNGGLNNGIQYVSWSAYASLTSSVDSSAILIASGATPPLSASGSRDISFTGQWPIRYGNYQLVVSVSVPPPPPVNTDMDSNLLNNVAATGSGSTTAVGFINEAEPNNDVTNLSVGGVQNLGIILQPGMSVLVSGNLSGVGDPDDVYTFNTGTAASVTVYVSWLPSGSQNVTLNYLTNSPVVTTLATIHSATETSLSLSSADPTGSQRWIDVANTGNATFPYTLIITGN